MAAMAQARSGWPVLPSHGIPPLHRLYSPGGQRAIVQQESGLPPPPLDPPSSPHFLDGHLHEVVQWVRTQDEGNPGALTPPARRPLLQPPQQLSVPPPAASPPSVPISAQPAWPEWMRLPGGHSDHGPCPISQELCLPRHSSRFPDLREQLPLSPAASSATDMSQLLPCGKLSVTRVPPPSPEPALQVPPLSPMSHLFPECYHCPPCLVCPQSPTTIP